MSQLITKIKQNATGVKNETRPCMNTAMRIGGLFEDIAEELEGKSDTLYIDVEIAKAKTYTDTKVADIVNSAPETLDTLKELSDALGNDPNFATSIATQIGRKVDKIEGKGLSANDFTNEDKAKLSKLSVEYDYIVDSDVKLLGLINNPDAINVLIKQGTWTSNQSIKLHPNCRRIIGEGGSNIVVNVASSGDSYGMYFATTPNIDKFTMENVTCNIMNSSVGYSYCFYKLSNMINCHSNNSANANRYGTGFNKCTNIRGCSGNGFKECDAISDCIATGNGKSTIYSHYYFCNNITNCTSESIESGSSFYKCNYLTNCSGSGFRECLYLANCISNDIGLGTTIDNSGTTYHGYGFLMCRFLTNCNGSATGAGTGYYRGYGFVNCSHLMSCEGYGVGYGSPAYYGYGFKGCYKVYMCSAKGSTAAYETSVAGSPNSSGTSCADTANGGWNSTFI